MIKDCHGGPLELSTPLRQSVESKYKVSGWADFEARGSGHLLHPHWFCIFYGFIKLTIVIG